MFQSLLEFVSQCLISLTVEILMCWGWFGEDENWYNMFEHFLDFLKTLLMKKGRKKLPQINKRLASCYPIDI